MATTKKGETVSSLFELGLPLFFIKITGHNLLTPLSEAFALAASGDFPPAKN